MDTLTNRTMRSCALHLQQPSPLPSSRNKCTYRTWVLSKGLDHNFAICRRCCTCSPRGSNLNFRKHLISAVYNFCYLIQKFQWRQVCNVLDASLRWEKGLDSPSRKRKAGTVAGRGGWRRASLLCDPESGLRLYKRESPNLGKDNKRAGGPQFL